MKTAGQIYLDILIAVAILGILSHALFSLVLSAYELISFNKARVTARHLALEKIELIRNLPYNQVGTLGGIPSGPLSQLEMVKKNNLVYKIKVDIIYIDDPFDKQAPADLLPTDYKRVRVDVSWGGVAASESNPVTLVTDIAPKGVESTTGGGTLSILVFNAEGQPVPQAEVKINASTNPPVDLNLKTADDGRLILPGAPVCNDCYQIQVTKAGYSSEKTYSTEEIANPSKPHVSVLAGQISEISFTIDKLSTLTIYSVQDAEHDFLPLPSQNFILKGEKILGRDSDDEVILKFEKMLTTDSNGVLVLNNLEWDNYHLSLPEGSPYDLSANNPLPPWVILPDKTYSATFALTSHTPHSLWLIFQDANQNLIASVAAQLTTESGFRASGSSGLADKPNFGQIFFKNLAALTYNLSATASGFSDYHGIIEVSGQTQEKIIMNQL